MKILLPAVTSDEIQGGGGDVLCRRQDAPSGAPLGPPRGLHLQ